MIKIFKVTGGVFDNLRRLKVKFFNGKSDVRTALEASPYGVDTFPVNDMIALYVKSETDGSDVVFGYINKNRLAEAGEARLFSTNTQGTFKFNLWLRADGTMLAGDSNVPAEFTNFAVKYNETKQELDKLKTTMDAMVQKWNAFAAAYVPGSPSTTGLPPNLSSSQVTANNSNFALIKNAKIKTN